MKLAARPSLTALFIQRPPLVFVTLALIAIAGGYALATLIRQQFPNVDMPTISVSASYPGASPSELRDAVVRPIEDAVAGAPGLQHITSSIQQNQATISASFALETNKTTDLTEVQDRIQNVRSVLPQDLPAPSVRSFDPAQATVVTLAVYSAKMSFTELSAIVNNTIVPRLEQVDGVSNAGATGSVTPALEVLLDPLKLAAYSYTSTDVVAAIQSSNSRRAGGILTLGNHETTLDVRADLQDVASLESTPVTVNTSTLQGATSVSGTTTARYSQQSGSTQQALNLAANNPGAATFTGSVNDFTAQPRRLNVGQIADVTDSYEPKRVVSYLNGSGAITINVQKTVDASEVTVSHNVLAALPAIEAAYPGVTFNVVNVQADETQAELNGVLITLAEGIAVTGLVMLVFLRSWRNAVVVMIAIPASLFTAMFIMRMAGMTLDSVSLLAMTLVIGILVDDSIVVLENTERRHRDGLPAAEAALRGRLEIGPAALVITLVDVVVFLPIAFLPGISGRYLSEFGLVVTIATLTSLAISFTITPSLAANWSLHSHWRPWKPIEAFHRGFARVQNGYSQRLLPGALRRPITITIACLLLTVGAIALVPLGAVGFEFIPAVDRGQIFVTVRFPTGTPLTTTDAAIRKLTAAYQKLSDVQQLTSSSGGSTSGFGGSVNSGSNGQIRIFLTPNHRQTTDAVAAVMTRIGTKLIPDGDVVAVPATGTRGGNAQPIDVTVSTTRGEPDAASIQIIQALTDTPGATNVNGSSQSLAPQIDIGFDRERARALNVDIGLASQAIRAAFGGTLATQFDVENGTKYVQVLYPMRDQQSLHTLLDLPLRTESGGLTHLGDIATLTNHPVAPIVSRSDRSTVVHIGANVAPGYSMSNVNAAFRARVAALHLPSSIILGAGTSGSQNNLNDTTHGIAVSLSLSLLLTYLLMVALYDAYRAPFVIMFSIPVAAIGALGALALTGQTLNLYSMIGVIMLVGLVSKNGILLIDFATHKVAAGYDKRSAVLEAARERLRPIIMTTFAMIAGMLPLALALDPGSAAKRSLGTVVIGGLTSSLLLTLVVVPIMFLWIAPAHRQEENPA